MKMRILLALIFFSITTLLGCTNTYSPRVNQDLLKENWMRYANIDARQWARGADRWFFTGEPNATEAYVRVAPNDKAMSIMAVKVPQFTNVNVNGCFQVQLVGEQDRNSVYILGPNDAVRQTLVQVHDNTVFVSQVTDGNARMANLKNVIVRIGVRNLRNLKIGGTLFVEGRNLTSDGLTIHSTNNGNVILSGDMNLFKVNNYGPGTVSILGAYTPCLYVVLRGSGTINVAGRVGVQSIDNIGGGSVHIVGADSRSLVVNAQSSGLTTVAGYVNLKRLVATGRSCVYMYWVNSNGAYITLRDFARVGLAGSATNLEMDLANNTRFEGQYLHGGSIYIQTRNNAHANIAADKKIFASAVDNSSIYFFGSPNIVSRYSAGQGSVIPVWSDTNALPIPSQVPSVVFTPRQRMYK